MRALAAIAVACGVAGPAGAELYRCIDAAGKLHFTDDPSVCERPVAHEPKARIQRSASQGSAPPAQEPARSQLPSDLSAAFPPAPGWEVLREAPDAPDAGLRARGLHASVARHYTRYRGRVSEVCTIELWAFARPAQAAAVREALARPRWWKRDAGAVLVIAHGMRVERGVGTRHGVIPACAKLAEATRDRVLAY